MNPPEATPQARIHLVCSIDYDYDDENYYAQEGYHVYRAYESEAEAAAYVHEGNVQDVLRADSLERWTDDGDPESLHKYDPDLLEKVREALELEELTAENLMWLTFPEGRKLTEEQARRLVELLGLGDHYVMSVDLYLRPGEAVEAAANTAA